MDQFDLQKAFSQMEYEEKELCLTEVRKFAYRLLQDSDMIAAGIREELRSAIVNQAICIDSHNREIQEEKQPFFSAADVARMTGKTKNTVCNYCKDGTINAEQIRGHWRIPRVEVERFSGLKNF